MLRATTRCYDMHVHGHRVLRDHLSDGTEDGRRHREEEEAVGAAARLEGLERGVEGDVRVCRVVPARMEGDALRERGLGQARILLDVGALLGNEGLEVHRLAPVADDLEAARQVAEQAELVERGEEFLLGKVARRAEDHNTQRHRLRGGSRVIRLAGEAEVAGTGAGCIG
eukprot:scaffold6433_cov67-Phaeocystis_antarctica.AAC.1